MKKVMLLILMLTLTSAYAQKANLDREYIRVNYIQLPSKPILDDSKRTFTTNSNGVTIAGFSKVSNDGSIDIEYSYDGTTIENTSIETRKKEKKDKNGNVISTTYTYRSHANFISRGSLHVYNSITGKHFNKRYSKSALYIGNSFKSHHRAQKDFDDNKYVLKRRKTGGHQREMLREAKSYVNDTYGYPVIDKKEQIWILGSKKHPEYAKHHEKFEEMKAIFDRMNYKEPVNNLETNLQDVITYFESVIPKYPGSKKKYRKMRYASYYAIAKIYYFLDNVEKTKEYGQKIIDNDYDKKDGKHFIKWAEKLEKRFNSNQTTTRHFNVLTEDLTQSNLQNDIVEDRTTDDVLAYLITKSNDTITASISNANMLKINYGVDLILTDDKGRTKTSHYNATDCKTLALTNEDLYKVVAFDEVKKGGINSELKFAKSLYESDKIELLLFNNEELILKKADSKGVSTLSSSFAFGFNKKLATFCDDCPSLIERTKDKEFKNNAESLIAFCKAYAKCK